MPNTLFDGPTGLEFHRNVIASLAAYGEQLQKEFSEQTGIEVECKFVARALRGITMRLHPVNVLKEGLPDTRARIYKFLKHKLPYMNTYIAMAVIKTLGKSVVVETHDEDSSKRGEGQWMGDLSFNDKKHDPDSLGIDWGGANTR